MADEPRPWWYSGEDSGDQGVGGEGEPGQPELGEPGDDDAVPIDWTAMLSGAMRMMDWDTSAVMAPHAEHEDPAEHPQCVVCRGILLMGGQRTVPAAASDENDRRAATPITWIPISDGPAG